MVKRGSSRSTRDEIHSAASQLFREHGFARTSVRDIAALAQTSPALVIRHFGTKELLFLETVHLTMDSEPLLDVPLESLGERFVSVLLSSDDDIRSVYLALIRGSNEPRIADRLKESHETAFVEPLRARLSGPDADTRARLAAAVVAGLLYALWVVGDARLAADPHQVIVRYGAILQRILTPHD